MGANDVCGRDFRVDRRDEEPVAQSVGPGGGRWWILELFGSHLLVDHETPRSNDFPSSAPELLGIGF